MLGPQAPAPCAGAVLADLGWPLRSAPSDRERLRALARELRDDAGLGTAWPATMGWARAAPRPVATRHDTRVRDPELLAELAAGERSR